LAVSTFSFVLPVSGRSELSAPLPDITSLLNYKNHSKICSSHLLFRGHFQHLERFLFLVLRSRFRASFSIYIYIYIHTHTQNVQQDATLVSWFYYKITLHVSGTFRTDHQQYNNCSWQPLVQHMLRRFVNLVVTSVLKTVQDRAVGHITVV
jgi:hypothetical protein